MRIQGSANVGVVVLLAVVLGLVPVSIGWAQQAIPPSAGLNVAFAAVSVYIYLLNGNL